MLIVAVPSEWRLVQVGRAPAAPAVPTIAATVPGCVHTDLLAAGVIDDPLVGTHEADLEWVADCEWRYETSLDLPAEALAHDRVELVFDGLDTLATVEVNGRVVAETANMHRRHRAGLDTVARPGTNDVAVAFRSATLFSEAARRCDDSWPTASFGRPYNRLRKMACSWGWDWGPWLTTCGIWRPARVVAWSGARLDGVRPAAAVAEDDRGRVSVAVDVVAPTGGAPSAATPVAVTTRLVAPGGAVIATSESEVTGATTVVELDAGTVERWWPHSHGPQPRYELEVELVADDGAILDRASQRVGFRTIELDTAPDAIGSAFTILVNGRPVFARGVNWIPDDVFPTRVDPGRYVARLRQAVDAHADLVRVWGGGIYEDDVFYDTCDELGLLVWQDFAFACAAYPEDDLRDEVDAEARDNVSRLMHHPSLAVWNGNNENIWGYWDWDWQAPLAGRPWGGGFYHDLLPRVCAELDPTRPYWPGSPYSGSDDVAPNADAQGCVHLWEQWNRIDLDRYRDHAPRFVSEFGWQAPATWATMRTALHDLRRDSPGMRLHQKAIDGDAKLDRGIAARFGEITDLDAFWYASQLVQARAVTTGVEHFRALRPWCMGTLWWQLNDCWPAVSWALVDSGGRRKPAWYALRAAYRDRLLTVQPRGDSLVVFAVNETPDAWEIATSARRVDLLGAELAAAPIAIDVAPWSVGRVELPGDVVATRHPTDEVLVVGTGDERAWWWYAADRELGLARPGWQLDRRDGDRAIELALTADTVVRDLIVFADRLSPDASIDRQLVSLLPGEEVVLGVAGLDHVDTDVETLLRPPVCWTAADLIPPR